MPKNRRILQNFVLGQTDVLSSNYEVTSDWNNDDYTPGINIYYLHVYFVCFQSLDYDDCENFLYLEEERLKGYKYVVKKNVCRWLMFLLIGVFTAFVGIYVDVSIEEIAKIKYRKLKECILFTSVSCSKPIPFSSIVWKFLDDKNRFRRIKFETYLIKTYCVLDRCECDSSIYWFCIGNLCRSAYILFRSLNLRQIVKRNKMFYLQPIALGSGIPQVKCYLNGIKMPRLVRFKTLFVKTTGVITTVVGGLAGGKVNLTFL